MNNQYIDTTSYTNKDFKSIWPELLELVTDLTDKWDPNNSNEADPGVALLKLKAFVADKLNYNIDKNTLETFPSSVTQRGNALKLYDSLGYELKWYKSAKTGLHFKFSNPSVDSEITEDTGVVTFTIPRFTQVCDSENKITYTTLESTILDSNENTQTEFEIEAIEGSIESYLINGSDKITINNLDADYRLYFTEHMIASNGIFINNIGSDEFWESSFNLESTNAGRKVFKFGVLPTSNQCYIQFPQDAAELFEQGINIHYIISSGSKGNIRAKFLTNFAQEYPTYGVDDLDNTYSLNKYIKVLNLSGTTSGQDPESLESAYKNYQRTVNTFSTLVTLQDYFNAIYNSEKVSNVIVTDRLTDFNSSYKVKNRSTIGIKDELFETYREGDREDALRMNAFNLAIYPLNSVMNVYDAQTYANTFKTSVEASNEAKEVVEEMKSVQHDWASINSATLSAFMFKNMIGLSGQLITYQKVSTSEAKQIIDKIKAKIYETYQSRNIEFGKDLLLDDIVQTIKNADSRVKDFLIDDPTYYTDIMYADNSQYSLLSTYPDSDTNTMLSDLLLEIIARSILAGVTPLFLFDTDTTYSYTMKPIGSYTKVSASPAASQIKYDEIDESLTLNSSPTADSSKPVTESYKEISAITTQVNVPLDWSKQIVRIGNSVYDIDVEYNEAANPQLPVIKSSNINFHKDYIGKNGSGWQWYGIPNYALYDIVLHKGSIWICHNASGSYAKEPSDSSDSWSTLLSYSEGSEYNENTFVYDSEGQIYKCKNKTTNSLDSTTDWEKIQGKTYDMTVEPSQVIYTLNSDMRVRNIANNNIVSEIAGYKLKTNETLFMYAPSYISKALMSTYLNICIKDTTNSLAIIPADSLYQLKAGLTLYVSETVYEDAQRSTSIFATNNKYLPTSSIDIDNIRKAGKAYREYGPGTIIKPSFDLKFEVKGGINHGLTTELLNYINLESDKTIDIMEANTTKINKKSSDSADVATKKVYCAWITDDVNNYLFNTADIKAVKDSDQYIEHILQQNELFMYTDATKSDLILLQSGTRLKIPYSATSFNKDFWRMDKPSSSEINQNGLDALDTYWKEIPRNLAYFEVEELEILTLGAGVTIYNTSKNNPTSIANEARAITDVGAISWEYDGEPFNLPLILIDGNSGWKAFSRLAIFSSPETICTLGEHLSLCLFERVSSYNDLEERTEYSYDAKYVMGPGQSFTSNFVAVLSGGIKQDVRILKEDDTTEPLIISPFKYVEVSDGLLNQKLWDSISVLYNKAEKEGNNIPAIDPNTNKPADIDLMSLDTTDSEDKKLLTEIAGGGQISVTIDSENICYTNLRFSGERFVNNNTITLSTKFSGLFSGSGTSGTLIPIIINAPASNQFEFNIPEYGDTITDRTFNTITYQDSLICLNYVRPDTGEFTITITNVNKDDNILITMYPPRHYTGYNTTYLIDSAPSQSEAAIINKVLTLSSVIVDETTSPPRTASRFDFTYLEDEENQILNPLDPLSFYKENHICNKFLMSQINSLDIKLARLSKQ